MRIDRLDLTAFGPFTGVSLDLQGGSQGLHVVYGPNEAGKSSALRALTQFFCGIPPRTADDFIHPYKNLQIGATLRGRDGTVLGLVRWKKLKNPLVPDDGGPPEEAEARLARLLGGEPAAEFVRKWVLDHAALGQGGKALVEGGGDLGGALFAAGGQGLAAVGAVQRALAAEAEALFKARGEKPEINARLGEWEAVTKALRAAALPSSEYVRHDRARADALLRKAEAEAQLVAAETEKARLTRLAGAVEPAARRRDALAELATLADVPRLAANFGYQRLEVGSRLPAQAEFATEARARVGRLDEQIAAAVVPDDLLAEAEAVESLHQRLGALRKAAADRGRRDADLVRVAAEVRAALRELGHDPTRADDLTRPDADDGPLAALRLSAAQCRDLDDLASRRPEVEQAVAAARAALEAATARRAAVARELSALGPERDPGPLKKALRDARRPGDLDDARRQARDDLERAEGRAAAALKKLGRWSVPAAAVETLAVPTAEAVDAAQEALDALDREAGDLDREALELEAQARAADARLLAWDEAGAVPTEESLDAARRRRDAAWTDLERSGWDAALAAAYPPTVRAADDLADRLRREADRVAGRAQLVADRARLDRELADRRARRARVEHARAAALARWADLWADSGVDAPDAPRVMRGWLRKQAEAAELSRTAREARETLDRLDAQAAALSATLRAALGLPTGEPDLGPLAERLDQAQEALDDATAALAARKRLTAELLGIDDQLPALGRAVTQAEADRDAWRARWAAATALLNVDPAASNAVVSEARKRTEALFERLDRARALRRQAEADAAEAARFAADVRALAGRVAPDLDADPDGFDPGAAAAALYQRLTAARAARLHRDNLVANRDERLAEAEAAEAELARLRNELAALRRAAGVATDDGLAEVEARDRRRAALEAERVSLDAELRRHAAGRPLEAFLDEVGQVDPDALAPRIDRKADEIEALRRDLDAVNQTIGHETSELSRMTGHSDAADLGQQAEGLRSRVRADVEQLARLRLAAAVLREGIERYRHRAQAPVLTRAEAIFRRLTLGSFTGLRAELNEKDQPVVRAVRDGQALDLDALSLGTADQLYLALRLATLDDHLDRRGPLPLVLDDLLIQFDDARAAATLDVLAEFSTKTQVILFTHHAHLVGLASGRLSPQALFVHELPGRAAAAPAGSP